jgi:hypothetical protein
VLQIIDEAFTWTGVSPYLDTRACCKYTISYMHSLTLRYHTFNTIREDIGNKTFLANT